jgi:ABC-2 type transport system permease protein
MSGSRKVGRLSVAAAAWVVARRDFTAILMSRTFLFFLLGPLFPVLVGGLAGSVGQRVQQTVDAPEVGIVMQGEDADAMVRARDRLAGTIGNVLPGFTVIRRLQPGESFDPRSALDGSRVNLAAVLSGSVDRPVLTGPEEQLSRWRGAIALVAGEARAGQTLALPEVRMDRTATSQASERTGRLRTAQSTQMLLFLLTMMLAGMVLSNLVEEKGNKIIEVLAAAIPMDAVFFGKLFAMLGVSFVAIAVWGVVGAAIVVAAGPAIPELPEPAVGWPMLFTLGVVYFAMAYLLIGSVFLSIGSMATTVREVQTMSMPVTMMQLLVFFFAGFAMTQPGSVLELSAVLFPFSSPFAMLARAAQEPALLPHVLAVLWQAAWVFALVRLGAMLFRVRVMKSGPARRRKGLRSRLRRNAQGEEAPPVPAE